MQKESVGLSDPSVQRALHIHTTFDDQIPYFQNRVYKLGYGKPELIHIYEITNNLLYVNFKNKQEELGPGALSVWHATYPHVCDNICLTGFQNRSGLGKWFGDGIYTTSYIDVALHYALKQYPPVAENKEGKFVRVILSRATIGMMKDINKYHKDQPMEEGVDSHRVLHTDGGRLGTPLEYSKSRRPFSKLLATGRGKLTGEELVLKSEDQLLPRFIVTFFVPFR